MATFNKKEKEKKRLKKRQDKQKKKEERKANSNKGGDLESMMAYVDENGQISDTPPDPTKKKEIKAEDIELGPSSRPEEDEDPIKEGKLDFFNDEKGYGFIKESNSQNKYFVHINNIIDDIGPDDKLAFELEMGMKGMQAVRVKKASPKPTPPPAAPTPPPSDSSEQDEPK